MEEDTQHGGREEYVPIDDLVKRIHYSRQSIYNMISKGVFVRGVHYIKPSPKKVLFIWRAVKAWLERPPDDPPEKPATTGTARYKMRS